MRDPGLYPGRKEGNIIKDVGAVGRIEYGLYIK